ncbi:MAG: hypothetical protein JJU33_00665 [Phycisphaerales bacterium]|nr:hypothetical protein [Phycisphaerales bacterium]
MRSHWPPPPVAGDLLVVDQIAIRSEDAWSSVAGRALLEAGVPPASASAFRDVGLSRFDRDLDNWARVPGTTALSEGPVFHLRLPIDKQVGDQPAACTVTFTPDLTVNIQHRFGVERGEAPESLRVRWRSDLETDPEFDKRGWARGVVWKRANVSADETFSIAPGQSVARRIAVDLKTGAELVQMLHMVDPSECIGIAVYMVDRDTLAEAAEGLAHPTAPQAGGWRVSIAAGEAAKLLADRLDERRDEDRLPCIAWGYHNGLHLVFMPWHEPRGRIHIASDLERSGARRYFLMDTGLDETVRLPLEPDRAMVVQRRDGGPTMSSPFVARSVDLLVVTRGHAGVGVLRQDWSRAYGGR